MKISLEKKEKEKKKNTSTKSASSWLSALKKPTTIKPRAKAKLGQDMLLYFVKNFLIIEICSYWLSKSQNGSFKS